MIITEFALFFARNVVACRHAVLTFSSDARTVTIRGVVSDDVASIVGILFGYGAEEFEERRVALQGDEGDVERVAVVVAEVIDAIVRTN